MANRYWYGGTDTWDATAGSKWSDIDNISGVGQTVPTSSDDVYFTAGAGAVTVTLSGTTTCNGLNINFTGFLPSCSIMIYICLQKNAKHINY